jgi:hypothetical protein
MLSDALLVSNPAVRMRPNRMVRLEEPRFDLGDIEPDEVTPFT